MEKLVVIDGNSILNRAFYGIMGSKMLQTADGTYTNAVYGFLNILFKLLEDTTPEYLVVAFDLKAPTKRHIMYKEYKGTRKQMPEELAQQMPIIKEILQAMNITILEKEGYEADDILGTLSRLGENNNLEVILLTGDRDSFQLTTDKTIVRIPRTKAGKTETENFDRNKIIETYGVEPEKLIEVKGLMGDTSDNIPGVPGVGEKTALNLIKEYETIDNLYEKLEKNEDNVKGKLRERLIENKESAFLSRELGKIDVEAEIDREIEHFKLEEWDKSKVLELFKKYRFNRFIDRFDLSEGTKENEELQIKFEYKKANFDEVNQLIKSINNQKRMFYKIKYIDNQDETLIIKKEIQSIYVYHEEEKIAYIVEKNMVDDILKVLEDETILKCGENIKEDYVVLKQMKQEPKNFMFDVCIAGYLINSASNLHTIEELANQFLELDLLEYISFLSEGEENIDQMNLFDMVPKEEKTFDAETLVKLYAIYLLYDKLIEEMKKNELLNLFETIEMPTMEVLAEMQVNGIYVDKKELENFGNTLKEQIEILTKEIYELVGEEFNINSTKQLGEILFEKLKLTVNKKTKNGYSTDVETLEKIKNEHPVIEKILAYRQIAKLNSTYVEGLIPFIHKETNRIHTYFHQTVTATGRISSSDPNLQNIPTRTDMGKELRKVFKATGENILVDADYSQIELRVLAHISNDEKMLKAFQNDEDIHAWAASHVFEVPIEEVSKELRAKAKAVNFGIVYGISDFGLSEQLGIPVKEAKVYINQYLEKYSGIKKFMDDIVEVAKEKGYVESLFHRRRYIPELKSNNYMIRKFGDRVAMNTPIQGTAADIMKIAMVRLYQALKEQKLKSKILLQVHDELLLEVSKEEIEIVKVLTKETMESAIRLNIPLKVDIEEGISWNDAK